MFGGREDVGKSEKEHYAHLFFGHSKTRVSMVSVWIRSRNH